MCPTPRMTYATSLRRPVQFLSKKLVRRHVVLADVGLGVPVGNTIEHMVPQSILKKIAPGARLERDMLNLVTLPNSMNCAHGSHKIGERWIPPVHLRGLYARAALYIADIGPRALEVVNDLAMPIDLAKEWDRESPLTVAVRDRMVTLAMAQGPFVLRADEGAMVWRRADALEVLRPGSSIDDR